MRTTPPYYPGAARYALPSALLHDLRTPLNHILGFSQLLIDEAQDAADTEYLADLDKIRIAGGQLLALIDANFHTRTTLPESIVAPAENDVAPVMRSGTPPAQAQGSLLVVDDTESNRDVLSRLLEKQGYRVATAENGRLALEMLNSVFFDVVLLDIMMPELDGYEVLQRLKEDPQLRHIPVIMISALSEMDAVVRCIDLGAEDYLPKPFNSTLLKARIGACLEKKRAHDRETLLFQQLQDNYHRLQELEKQRDGLTSMIIHDLRTPLSAVIGGMQTLDMTGELNEAQREMMVMAVTGGQSLLRLINDLLDVGQWEADVMPMNSTVVMVGELVAMAISQVDWLAQNKNLRVTSQIAPDLPPLRGDGDKLIRVLVNLLGNAIKFTRSGGMVAVQVRVSKDNQAVEFCVSDTGEGIPPEAFEHIFEKFGQVEARQGGRAMSTGLGLTFCKLAVEAHGGTIWVESVMGRGSTFCFSIPVGAG